MLPPDNKRIINGVVGGYGRLVLSRLVKKHVSEFSLGLITGISKLAHFFCCRLRPASAADTAMISRNDLRHSNANGFCVPFAVITAAAKASL